MTSPSRARQRQTALSATLVGSLLGSVVGGLMMRIAWVHNAQGEIHDGGRVDWGYWLLLGASWAVPVALASGGLAWLVLSVARRRPGE